MHVADDMDLQLRIKALIEEEHALRDAVSDRSITPEEEQRRLRTIEVELDQCWDLLRQRRARREYGESPSDAQLRDEGTVEGYEG